MDKKLEQRFHDEVRAVVDVLVNADNLRQEFATDSEDLKLYSQWQEVLTKAYDIVVSFADEHEIYVD